jgi:hypothetical protein
MFQKDNPLLSTFALGGCATLSQLSNHIKDVS